MPDITKTVVGGKTIFTGEGTADVVKPGANVSEVQADDSVGAANVIVYEPVVDPQPRRAATQETIGFAAAHRRGVSGNDLFITVEATSPITSFEAWLDGQELANERMSDRPIVLERNFRQVGSASPGLKHCLKLRAYTEHGLIQTYRHEWEDSI